MFDRSFFFGSELFECAKHVLYNIVQTNSRQRVNDVVSYNVAYCSVTSRANHLERKCQGATPYPSTGWHKASEDRVGWCVCVCVCVCEKEVCLKGFRGLHERIGMAFR